MRKVIVVTSSYSADDIKKIGGQAGLLPIIKESGADGVEIRRELLTPENLSVLAPLSHKIKECRLSCVYSVPFPLFISQRLNPQLRQYLVEADSLNAGLIKFSLGDFRHSAEAGDVLKDILNRFSCIQLAVENDQGKSSGSLSAMKYFADWVRHNDLPVKLVFDTGNWVWVEEDVQKAADTLAGQVGYVHVKSVTLNSAGEPVAVPPQNEEDTYLEIARQFPPNIELGIEFPLIGDDLLKSTAYFVNLLKG